MTAAAFVAFLLLVWALSSSYGALHVTACLSILLILVALVPVVYRWACEVFSN